MKEYNVKRATRALILWMVVCTLAIVSPAAWAVIVGSLPYTLTNGTTADATQVMANYQKIVDDVNANAAARGANSDITALLGLTTPLGATSGGTNQWYGGTSTGTANAQVVATLSPISFARTTGYSASFIAGFTNTGTTTLNLNGTGATNVFKSSAAGPVALGGGEIVSGNPTIVRYDGTQYVLMTEGRRQWGAETNLASGGTTDLGTIPSHNINVTGVTTITALGSAASLTDPLYKIKFAGALTLTHNATSLILPGAQNITTQAGDTAEVEYLGAGNWRVREFGQLGGLSRTNVYTANNTWTRATGERGVLFVCAGGGGAGGGAGDTAANQSSGGAGGGGGGWATRYIASAAASYTITIGAGGTGVSDATGNNGAATTVGAVLTCNGGTGGARIAASTTTARVSGAAGGTAASGDVNKTGSAGGDALASADSGAVYWAVGGIGGANALGQGGAQSVAVTGSGTTQAGAGCGGGGGGATSAGTAGTAQAGGAGADGCVIAYTYY